MCGSAFGQWRMPAYRRIMNGMMSPSAPRANLPASAATRNRPGVAFGSAAVIESPSAPNTKIAAITRGAWKRSSRKPLTRRPLATPIAPSEATEAATPVDAAVEQQRQQVGAEADGGGGGDQHAEEEDEVAGIAEHLAHRHAGVFLLHRCVGAQVHALGARDGPDDQCDGGARERNAACGRCRRLG